MGLQNVRFADKNGNGGSGGDGGGNNDERERQRERKSATEENKKCHSYENNDHDDK